MIDNVRQRVAKLGDLETAHAEGPHEPRSLLRARTPGVIFSDGQ